MTYQFDVLENTKAKLRFHFHDETWSGSLLTFSEDFYYGNALVPFRIYRLALLWLHVTGNVEDIGNQITLIRMV